MSAAFQLSVCPHDTAKNLAGWFLLNTYLQRHLDRSIHFEPADNFDREREMVLGGNFHIVYANPYSACCYQRELGFIPVARPKSVFDETYLVARHGAGLPSARPLVVASATDRLMVHYLGLHLLVDLGIGRDEVEFRFVGSHPKAAQAVLKGEAKLGFVFNETWHGLARSTQQELEVVAQTRSGQAYHCFCIAPEWKSQRLAIQRVLCEMSENDKGRAILKDLGFVGFEPVAEDALRELQAMWERLAG